MQLDRNGYYDLPPGKIASLVTYLEMTERPVLRPPPDLPGLTLRRVERPDLDWYRDPVSPDRYRLALVRPPGDARRRGPGHHRARRRRGPRADARRQGRGPGGARPARGSGHRARLFRRHARADGAGRRPLADAARAGAGLAPRAAAPVGPHLYPRPSRQRSRSTSDPAFVPTAVPSRSPTIRACSAWRRATPQVGCR